MTRVLLFTQIGDGRPTVAHTVPTYYGDHEVGWWVGDFRAFMSVNASGPPMRHWKKFQRAAFEADRWWLVECENAEAGRAVIAATVDCRGVPLDKSKPFLTVTVDGELCEGRILASGGKR